MRLALPLVIAALAAGPVRAQNAAATFPPSPSGYTTFSMPSGNVECVFTPAGGSKVYKPLDGGPELSCDRRDPAYVHLTMTPKRVEIDNNPGERGCCGVDNPFAYGATWSLGGFTCVSAQSGLVCKREDGRGFSISRAEVKKF